MKTSSPQAYMPEIKSKKDWEFASRLLTMLKRPISIPGEYLHDQKISSGAIRLWLCYNLISDKYGRSWWHQDKIANVFGLSIPSIRRHTAELIKAGYMENLKGEKGQNIIKLIWPDNCPNPKATIEQARLNRIARELDLNSCD